MLQLSCDNKSNRMLSKSAMNTVTQITRRRQAIIEYSKNKGVTAAARRYNVSRQYIYRWRNRYNGTLESLKDRAHRPHSHPKQHTPEELKLIENMRKRNAHTGLVVLWVKLRQKGYTRSITSLWRMLKKRNLMPVKPPNPKYVPKPYEKKSYPGQRAQIDVKFVPESCIVGDAKVEGKKFYQYTAIDEYSRYRYLEAFEEHSSYSSAVFLEHMLKAFQFPVECVQTDNGQEFTKRLGSSANPTPTLFEACLKQRGIKHKLIKPYTPRHNGKVERSHRKDNDIVNIALHISLKNLFHCGRRFACLIRVISAALLCRRHSAYRRAYPAVIPIAHIVAPDHCFQLLCRVIRTFSAAAVKQLVLHSRNQPTNAFAAGVVMTSASGAVHALLYSILVQRSSV